ncbi:MAG TPA: hypothetical protein VG675_18450 [Bryobacteraceae bacterium]|nr:hypothetical protein [Bryobacteraceae bacterium]
MGAKPPTVATFFDRNRSTPASYQVNFEVQDEVASNLVLEAGYMGNVSHHLTAGDFTINQVPPQFMGPGNSQLLRPFPQFSDVSESAGG